MLTTQFDGGLRARPLEARADRDAGVIWFVTDVRGAKDDEIDAANDIGLVFIDENSRAYLSITGRASVTRDTGKAKEIWKRTDCVWLSGGPDDPNARVLRVEPITAELWDGPSSAAGTAFEFAKARLTGEKPNLRRKSQSYRVDALKLFWSSFPVETHDPVVQALTTSKRNPL